MIERGECEQFLTGTERNPARWWWAAPRRGVAVSSGSAGVCHVDFSARVCSSLRWSSRLGSVDTYRTVSGRNSRQRVEHWIVLLAEQSNRALEREGSGATSEPEAEGRGGERCRGATFTAGRELQRPVAVKDPAPPGQKTAVLARASARDGPLGTPWDFSQIKNLL